MSKLFYFLYIFVLFLFLLFSYLFVDPNFLYLKSFYTGFYFTYRNLATLIYVLFISLFFGFYILFLYKIKRKIINISETKLLIVVTVVILFVTYPAILSHDIFNYTTTAKVLYYYKENPYIVMPIEFVNEPFLLYTHAANKIALYGPSWLALTYFPHLFGFGNLLLTIINFKLINVMFFLATIYLIWKISKNIFSVSLFALNPLVLIETLVSNHNDIIMMFFALLACFYIFKRKIFFAFICLFLSILIKYSTVFLLPVFIYTSWKMINKEKINTNIFFLFASISMFVVFLISPIREEIYPWYAIWFLTFLSFIISNKYTLFLSIIFSFSLLLRYIPFMFYGTHFGSTPAIKFLVTFAPVTFFTLIYFIKSKIWLRKYFSF